MDCYREIEPNVFVYGEYFYKEKTELTVKPIKNGKRYCLKFIYPASSNMLPIADIITFYSKRIHVNNFYGISSNPTVNNLSLILEAMDTKTVSSQTSSFSFKKKREHIGVIDGEDLFYIPIFHYGYYNSLRQEVPVWTLYSYPLDNEISQLLYETYHLTCKPKTIYKVYNISKRLLGKIDWLNKLFLYEDKRHGIVCEYDLFDYLLATIDSCSNEAFPIIDALCKKVEQENRYHSRKVSTSLLRALRANAKKHDNYNNNKYALLLIETLSKIIERKLYKQIWYR